jgi:hypothetical protein
MLYQIEIKKILKMRKRGKSVDDIAKETGHSKTTVTKYLKQPIKQYAQRNWRTRQNPFDEVKEEIKEMFRVNPTLEGTSLLEYLIEKHPGKFIEGHLRSLQRYLKILRAEIGPDKEVIFPQEHKPGETSSSDFTHMNSLNITIEGEKFDHLFYHFTLTYSNWEWGKICFSESLESLRSGLRECLIRAGGVTKEHLTDSLTAAVHNIHPKGEFKDRYAEILSAFGMNGRRTQPRCPNENGDNEQRHYRFKRALDQALMLRGSRNFQSIKEYEQFLHKLLHKLNSTRQEKVDEETKALLPLPEVVIPEYTMERPRVSSCCTIRIRNCSYSVPSRLIGEEVEARVYDDRIEVWYAQKQVLNTPRLRGQNKNTIDYRHIIGSLRRKPGAFKNYRYRESLYPTTTFKLSYENVIQADSLRGHKVYLEILEMAALNGQEKVEKVLSYLLKNKDVLQLEEIKALVEKEEAPDICDVHVAQPDLNEYDKAFGLGGCAC